MNKGIFLLVTLLSLTGLIAENTNTTNNNVGVNYRFNDAVTFTERGIEFHVFLDGGFDFNTNNNNHSYYDYNGNKIRRNIQIKRNRYGVIKRVGNSVINYSFNGNVSRIGNVVVRYRFGQLSSVGNLNIEYDRWGYPHFSGFVKPNRYYNNDFNVAINLGSICDYDDVYFYNRNFRNNYRQFREDSNFFYYRAIPNAKIGKRNKIIKRRKPNREVIKSNNRYLKNKKRANTINNRNGQKNKTVKTNNRNNQKNNKTVRTTRTIVKPNNKSVKTTRTVIKRKSASSKKQSANTKKITKRKIK